jgi:hypothetical protein
MTRERPLLRLASFQPRCLSLRPAGPALLALGIANLVLTASMITGGRAGTTWANEGAPAAAVPASEIVEIDLSSVDWHPQVPGKARKTQIDGGHVQNQASGETLFSGGVSIRLPNGVHIRVRTGTVRLRRDGQGRLTKLLVYPNAAIPPAKNGP